jgi:hypothetical protein
MLHAGTPVIGDEQVLDIEFDRNTVFRSAANSAQCLDPWNLYIESPRTRIAPGPAFPRAHPSHVLGDRRFAYLSCSYYFLFLQHMLFSLCHLFRSFH